MTLDLNHLKKLAMAATPGPWAWGSDWNRGAVYQAEKPHKRVVCSGNQNNENHFSEESWSGATWADAEFIAAASPATVLELIRLAEKGKACEKKASESHLVGGVPGNHNW